MDRHVLRNTLERLLRSDSRTFKGPWLRAGDRMNYKVTSTRHPAFSEDEFVATGEWTHDLTEAYNRLRKPRLLLTPYEGWNYSGSFDFLRDLWRIESFRLFNEIETDLTPLYERQELKKLGLLGVRISKKRPGLDFAQFPNLQVLDIRCWTGGMRNLDRSIRLKYLDIWGYNNVKEWDLSNCSELEVLEVHGARALETINLTGLKLLRSLTLLAVPKLTELRGVQDIVVRPDSWVRIDGAKRLDATILKHFSGAKHVSFQGKRIISEGKNVRPWPGFSS